MRLPRRCPFAMWGVCSGMSCQLGMVCTRVTVQVLEPVPMFRLGQRNACSESGPQISICGPPLIPPSPRGGGLIPGALPASGSPLRGAHCSRKDKGRHKLQPTLSPNPNPSPSPSPITLVTLAHPSPQPLSPQPLSPPPISPPASSQPLP